MSTKLKRKRISLQDGKDTVSIFFYESAEKIFLRNSHWLKTNNTLFSGLWLLNPQYKELWKLQSTVKLPTGSVCVISIWTHVLNEGMFIDLLRTSSETLNSCDNKDSNSVDWCRLWTRSWQTTWHIQLT